MSIVAAVKINDGIVLGADSATTISGQTAPGQIQVIKTYQNAQKLFRIGDLQAAILIYGIGNIGKRSVSSLIYEFNKSILQKEDRKTKSIEAISKELLSFLKKEYDSNFAVIPVQNRNQFQLGVYIAGFSESDVMANEWEFVFPFDAEVKKVRDISLTGTSWRGMTFPFQRIFNGFDPRLLDELIAKYRLSSEEVREIAKKYHSQVFFNGMPLQDAVDFLKYILLTTINNYRFEIGAQLCSEPIDIVAITAKEYSVISMKKLNF